MLRVLPAWTLAAGAVSILLLLGAFVVLWTEYDTLPDPFPTHYGISGQADAFGSKTPVRVFVPPAIGLTAWLMTWVNVIGFGFDVAQGRRKQGVPGLIWMTALSVLLAILFTVLSVSPVYRDRGLAAGAWIIGSVTAAILVVGVGGALRLMSLWRDDETPKDGWHLGMVYYNPDDPRFMVRPRDGLGVTVNFAYRITWLFPVGLAVILACVIALTSAG